MITYFATTASREFTTTSAAAAADVAHHWARRGEEAAVYVVGEDTDGQARCMEVPMGTSIKGTAKALAAAARGLRR